MPESLEQIYNLSMDWDTEGNKKTLINDKIASLVPNLLFELQIDTQPNTKQQSISRFMDSHRRPSKTLILVIKSNLLKMNEMKMKHENLGRNC